MSTWDFKYISTGEMNDYVDAGLLDFFQSMFINAYGEAVFKRTFSTGLGSVEFSYNARQDHVMMAMGKVSVTKNPIFSGDRPHDRLPTFDEDTVTRFIREEMVKVL